MEKLFVSSTVFVGGRVARVFRPLSTEPVLKVFILIKTIYRKRDVLANSINIKIALYFTLCKAVCNIYIIMHKIKLLISN